MRKSFLYRLQLFLTAAFLSACSTMTAQDKVVMRDVGIAAGIFTVWGVEEWEWFQHSPTFKQEKWFGQDTHAGGADKLGHLYVSYVLTDILINDFRNNNVENAETKGALGSLAAMTLIEIGDATSKKHGFSAEDFISDAAGVGASWWLMRHPKWDKRIDIRMEYWPSPGFDGSLGAAADYSGMKHLVALRGDSFNKFKGTPLEFLELQAGYYTRGFRLYDAGHFDEKKRYSYIGLGLNLPRIFRDVPIAGTLFEYYQPPGTHIEAKLEHSTN